MRLYDKYWNYRLVGEGSLIDNYGIESLNTMIVICWTPSSAIIRRDKTTEDKDVRLYSAFIDHMELYEFIMKIDPEERALYEVILGELSQKLHFDIDVPEDMMKDGDKIRDAVIISLMNVVNVNLVLAKDILVFTSHSTKKRSYHIVVDNYCVKNNKECRVAYNKVMEYSKNLLTREQLDRIDSSVYSKRQNFRLIGCTKKGEYRPKQIESKVIFNDEEYKIEINTSNDKMIWYDLFKKSLVSWTHESEYLTCFIVPQHMKRSYTGDAERDDLTEEQVNRCIDSLTEMMGEFPFTYEVKDGIVILHKTRCYKCIIHNRIHESENGYMVINGEYIVYYCRRDYSSIIIGQCDSKILVDEDETPIEANPMGILGRISSRNISSSNMTQFKPRIIEEGEDTIHNEVTTKTSDDRVIKSVIRASKIQPLCLSQVKDKPLKITRLEKKLTVDKRIYNTYLLSAIRRGD